MSSLLPLPEVVTRIRGEFVEMPCLRLTPAQAQRLWHLDATTCEALLSVLVQTGFLYRDSAGRYLRTSGSVTASVPRVAAAAATVAAGAA